MPKRKIHIIFFYILFFAAISNCELIAQSFTINVVRNNVTCFGAHDGIASCIPEGGVTPYEFKWSNGASSPTITGLDAGTYTITVTDGSGESAENGTFIIEPEELVVKTNPIHGFCNEFGSATVDVSGGSPPFTYAWSDGGTNPSIDDKLAGIYVVTVTDIKGCTIENSVQILVDTNNIEFETKIILPTCFEDNDGSIEIEMTKGTPPYTYRWNEEEGNKDLYDLAAGTYTLFIRDALDCSGGITVSLPQPDELRLSFLNTDDALIGRPEGGTPPYSYEWSTGYTEDGYLKNISEGSYGLTITDSNGCQVSGEGDYIGPLSTSNHFLLEHFSIAPNPAKDFIKVSLHTSPIIEDIQIQILNLNGQEIASTNFRNQKDIQQIFDLSHVQAGVYYLCILSNDEIIKADRFLIAR